MNVGHLDIAAGVTGLIAVAQALVHKQLPPAIHFRSPNPIHRSGEQPVLCQQRTLTLAGWSDAPPRRR